MRPMARLAARLLLAVPTLVGVTLVTFAIAHLAPGDPVTFAAGTSPVTQRLADENRRLVGLDRPLARRYGAWLARSATLDFGVSLTDGRSVRARIAEALPATAKLGLLAALLALLAAVPLGVAAAVGEGSAIGVALEVALSLAYGVPVLALALWMLAAGAPFGGGVAPAICLAIPSAILLARHQRSALLAVLGADYMTTARAVGASPARALLRHALPNALLPMVTLLGSQVPLLLSGSVLVERIFGIAGLGTLGYDAVLARDYPMLMGLATLSAALAIAGVLVADGAALLVDPRLQGEGAR